MLRLLDELYSILRVHIIIVAMLATVVFGWMITGEYPWLLSLFVGVDWLLINLLNRVTDIAEDLKNDIKGTPRLVNSGRLTMFIWLSIFAGSFLFSHWLFPQITWLRVVVQVIGVAYSVRLVPSITGLRRIKEFYFFKNFMSGVLFLLTCFIYFNAVKNGLLFSDEKLATTISLMASFLLFELTFEIVYDLRDLPGDKAEGIPTYPVVHGESVSLKIIYGLLAVSAFILVGSVLLKILGVREWGILIAIVVQTVFLRRKIKVGISRKDCIQMTNLASLQLALFLVGTWAWDTLSMDFNYYLFF